MKSVAGAGVVVTGAGGKAFVSGADISLQTSNDFGATWSDATTISIADSGAAAPMDQFFPSLVIG